MKKKILGMAAALMLLGAAPGAEAADNPFGDVPQAHWAYDAVAQLAKDGVIEGYGDGTYIGENAISRYEMAQMTARAMTRSGLKHSDKALVEKLAAEFGDELTQLGVRVKRLESKTDNVKFRGSVRYVWRNVRHGKGHPENAVHSNFNDLRLILWSNMRINDNWTAKARMQYVSDLKNARNITGADDTARMDRVYAEGRYNRGQLLIRLGKFDYESQIDDGMMFGGDNSISGGQVVFGKEVKVSLMAGRYHPPVSAPAADYTLSYQAVEVFSNKNKFTWGLGYNTYTCRKYAPQNKRVGIWEVGLGWKFDRNWWLATSYSRSNARGSSVLRTTPFGNGIQNQDKYAYSIALNYGQMNPGKLGSVYGFIAYRHLSHLGVIAQRLNLNNAMGPNQRGLHLGIGCTFAPLTVGTIEYFTGKDISNYSGHSSAKTIFGRLEAFF